MGENSVMRGSIFAEIEGLLFDGLGGSSVEEKEEKESLSSLRAPLLIAPLAEIIYDPNFK